MAVGNHMCLAKVCGDVRVTNLWDYRVHMVFIGLWKFGENGISFSRPWKSVKTEWGLRKFVNFVVFRALGKNFQLISQKLHFPRPNSSLNKTIAVQNQKEHFLSVLTDKVSAISYSKGCAPLLDVWKSCVPSCCFSTPYRKGLWKVCEFWKDFSVRTLD